ncbi:hypothetical protein [Halostella salina]|uniref:hypothetical protein n=1 Tax=Halostella salina TaxID=1547897 RepID=UPI000EF7AC11|nr:hypothetical protein [Halostella salina]
MTLSSCYFCGTAIEEPLAEYPVVPDALSPAPDDQVTVVLCPSCHRKLSTVTDRVVAAAEKRQRTLDEAGANAAAAASDEAGGGDGTAAEDETTDGDETTAGADRPSIDEGAAADLLGDDPLAAGEADEPAAAEAAADADDTDATADAEPAPTDEPSGPTDGGAGGITVDDADEAGTDDGSADAVTVDAGGGATDDADDPTGGAGDAAGSGASERADPTSAGDAPSQATYNRVVRLLQNREFPVERDEIATVAMNAYDIPPEDFDAVIQTAVNRGVLAEDGNYLQKPE